MGIPLRKCCESWEDEKHHRPDCALIAGPFWLVWNPEAGVPRQKHGLFSNARDEAMRLAMQNPGRKFYVLVVTGVAQTNAAVFSSI